MTTRRTPDAEFLREFPWLAPEPKKVERKPARRPKALSHPPRRWPRARRPPPQPSTDGG